jgi:hypothetical protein
MTKTSYMRFGAAAILALSLSACATVTRGTKQNFEFKSSPEGASMSTSTGVNCVTPCVLKMKRKDAFEVTFTKDGFEPQRARVESKIKGGGVVAGAGNLLVGGIIGGIVDGSNGSLNSLTPDKLDVTLVPLVTAAVDVVAAAVKTDDMMAPETGAAPTPN